MPLTAGLMVHAPMTGGGAPFAPDFYVSPTGSPSNNGSIGSPWSLSFALAGASGAITPGKTIALRGGTYSSINLSCALIGTATNRITFWGYPGENVRLQTGVGAGWNTWSGDYLTLRDVEIFYGAWTTRKSIFDDSTPGADLPVTNNLVWHGNYNWLIHCRVHDVAEILMEGGGGGHRIYGTLSYNNGWEGATLRGYAHGAYIQNWSSPRVRKYLESSVFFGNFGNQTQLYTTNQTNYDTSITNNVFFLGGNVTTLADDGFDLLTVKGGGDTSGLIVTGNCCFINPDNVDLTRQAFETFQAGDVGNDGQIENNVLMGKILVRNYGDGLLRFNNNTLYGPSGPTFMQLQEAPSSYSIYAWDNNQYHAMDNGQSFPFDIVPSPSNLTFAQWQATTGWDTHGSYTIDGTAFVGTTIRVIPVNEFETGRAYIVVYNWDRSATVAIPANLLTPVFTAGNSYDIREVQNLAVTSASGAWNGVSNISLPMTAVAPPDYIGGNQVNPLPTTGVLFHCFLLRKQGMWEV